jgi:hypothetical protein
MGVWAQRCYQEYRKDWMLGAVSKTQLGRIVSSYLMERVTAGGLDCRDRVAMLNPGT